ncbi:MAG: BCD family MFS transporter [Pseudomonadota bacterium]
MTLSWFQIVRLGLVQMALGAVVVLTTATMNRVMVVELALPAVLPGFLVSLYYATQFLRPRFGHGADQGGLRTPWIIGGVIVLVLGALSAANAVWLMASSPALGIAAAIPAFLLIGAGIGAAGTNLLALLSSRVSEDRQAAAGSLVWMMMIFGLAATGIIAGQVLDPFSPIRLLTVTAGVGTIAILLTLVGIWGQEDGSEGRPPERQIGFAQVARELWSDPRVRDFTIFVFASMLAYNLQDLILEPFAGQVFGMTVGESTALGGMHHAGALVGMLAVLLSGSLLSRWLSVPIRAWITGGCFLSGAALIAMGLGGNHADVWPIEANVFTLGLANGVFAVAAVGAMMRIAREGPESREGARMGFFGAAQAIAFGLGAFLGTAAADAMRFIFTSDALAYGLVFILEGAVFFAAAVLALKISTQGAETGGALPRETSS